MDKRSLILIPFFCIVAVISLIGSDTEASTMYQSVVFNEVESCWDMDEGSGVRVDSVGGPQAVNMTDNNTVGSVPGANGNAARFVALQSEYLNNISGNTTKIRLKDTGNPSGWTWTFWAQAGLQFAAPKAYMPVIMMGDIGNIPQRPNYTIWLYPEDTTLRIRMTIADATNTPRTLTYANTIPQGQWNLYVIKYDNNQIRVSMNAGVETIYGHSFGFTNTQAPLYFGVGHELDYLSYYTGNIDQITFHVEELSSDQIAFIYNYGSGRNCDDIFTGGPLLPPPTPTPTPAPTATPAASQAVISLPSGAQAILNYEVSAGDFLTIALLVIIITIILWYLVREFSHMAAKR